MDTRFTDQILSWGGIPQVTILTQLQLSLNGPASSRIPSAISFGESNNKFLVPHKTTKNFRLEKTGRLSAHLKRC